MATKPWYVQIDRSELDLTEKEPVVIGPFKSKAAARKHMHDSADVDDWCYGEAKASKYVVEDCYITQTPTIPSYGVNPPTFF